MSKICIIVPCYNEAKRLPIKEFLVFTEPDVSFCFVNDGSSDNTFEILKNLKKIKENIEVVDLKNNQGKAEAVRQGMLAMIAKDSFDYIGFIDADLSTPIHEILFIFNEMKKKDVILAFGSRIKKLGSAIQRNAYRHYLGRFFSTIASLMLNLDIYDTQCGAKIIKSTIAKELFKEHFISKWLFDIEIFARLINTFGRSDMRNLAIEVPLNKWLEKGGSKIKFSYMFKIPVELFRIFRHYKL